MSVQFGRWNFEGQQPASDYFEKVSAFLAPYGPDSNESYSTGGVKILYRAFHTTKESHREKQPHISSSGAVITWDGRLDNRADLINELRDSVIVNSTDVAIVAASYEKWGANCLRKLIGDWALSVWNPQRALLVARQRPHRHAPSLLLVRQQPGHLEHDPRSARPVRGKNLRDLRRVHCRLVLVLSCCASDALRRHPFRPAVLVRTPPTPEGTPSANIGISIQTRESVTAPTPNTRNTSALSSPQPSSAASVPIVPSSPNSVAAWTPPPSSAWPIPSSPAAPPTPLASTPSPGTTTPTTTSNPTQTNAASSPKSKKSAAEPAATSISAR